MTIGTLRVTEAIPAWKTVLDISELVPQDSWMLVGGLMTQVHAGLAGLASRATDDVDVLVDVLVADHLPAGRQKAAKVNTWPMLETPGGAQAIERKVEVEITSEIKGR